MTKVFASADGTVIAGIAGVAVTADVNLLDTLSSLLRSASSAGMTVADLHAPLVRACTQAAPSVQAYSSLATQVEHVTQPAHTVILLGGRVPLGPSSSLGTQLVVYGITDAPDPEFHPIRRSVVYAPVSVQAEAEQMLRRDSALPLEDQVASWGSKLSELAGYSIARQRLDLSEDFDAASVTSTYATAVRHHPAAPATPLPRH